MCQTEYIFNFILLMYSEHIGMYCIKILIHLLNPLYTFTLLNHKVEFPGTELCHQETTYCHNVNSYNQ